MVVIEGLEGKETIKSESDIVNARIAARSAAEAMGFGITDTTRIVTAVSALARNVFLHAGSGVMQWRQLEKSGAIGIELKFEDSGAGIANVEQAMTEGHSTRSGFGGGLPGVKRLMDEMEIESQVGKGTTVTVRKWLRGWQYGATETAVNGGHTLHNSN